MFCFSALHLQIATLFLAPHEVLFLRHRVFREYAKVSIGPDFIHTLPSFLILTTAILILRKNHPSFPRLQRLVGSTSLYRGLQVLVDWFAINALLWLWLILQRMLYCSVWHYWSYESEYRNVSYPWWQRVWFSYYPVAVQPVMSASFISWVIAMSIAISSLGCVIFIDHIRIIITESLTKVQERLAIVKSHALWLWKMSRLMPRKQEAVVSNEVNVAQDDSEIGSVYCDGYSEASIDASSAVKGDVHPISYGTNWMPQPNFSKEAQRKISIKSLHTMAGVNDVQDKSSTKQVRYRRGCHTVIPSKSSE